MFKKSNSFESNGLNTVNIKCSIIIPKQKEELLNKYFGHSRYIYNWAIDLNNERYKNNEQTLNYVNLSKLLPSLKKEKEFLKEVDSTTLQQALQDYWTTMQNFFNKKCGFPKFRSKHKKQTIRILNVKSEKPNHNSIRIEGNNIKLGKLGWVRIKPNQTIPNGDIQFVTIKRTKSGKIYATLTIRRSDEISQFDKTGKEVGIDVGVKDFACFSDGVVILKPDFLEKDDKKLRKLHRQLSRKQKNSKNREKAIHKLAVAYEKDRNRREDFLNKLSLSIVRDYDLIVMENLDIQSMLKDKKNKNLHKPISEIGWCSFTKKVKYKSEWYGKVFVQVEKSFPSSQLCSHCGYKNTETKDLSIRKWICPECRTVHDRDRNASINILREGKRIISE